MPGPPRFLLGAALLFWGGMTERPVPALACALLVEGAHWARVRWNFGERAFLLGWRLSVLFLLVAMVLVLLDGARISAMARVFTWLPVILLPLQFVQSYGMSRTMTLATFSMMVRRRRDHALKYGLPFREVRFSFGSVFFCCVLLASCLGPRAESAFFFPGLVMLAGWSLVGAAGRGWRGLGTATAVALLAAAAGGLGGEMGLTSLYQYITSGRGGSGSGTMLNPIEAETSITSLSKIEQSPEIKWRLIPESGPLPKLIRVASYNSFSGRKWKSELMPEGTDLQRDGFQPLAEIANPANPDDPEDKFIIAPPELPDLKVAADPALPRFRLRGATAPGRTVLLPLPAHAASLHGFEAEDFERSPFGVFRFKPAQPVADARVLWRDDFATELPPWTAMESTVVRLPPDQIQLAGKDREVRKARVQPDSQIPADEAVMLRRVVDGIGLRPGNLAEKIEMLRGHFARNFRYTRRNYTQEDYDKKRDGTLMRKFLTKTKAGHCEFFATATALLLREAGVPTRYVTGYAVVEFDRKTGQALLRGVHTHAWCRAWDSAAGRWIDVDLTPPDWTGKETPQMDPFQGVSDWFQRKREDLLVWRDQPGHMALLTAGMLAPILVGLGFIGRNLWRTRNRVDEVKARRYGASTLPVTPLLSLEKPARRLLGERPPGTPLVPWLWQLSPRLADPGMLAEALKLHHRLRFDPEAGGPELVTELQGLVTRLRRDLDARRA